MVAVVPAYKPDEKMLNVVSDLREAGFSVIVVNDGSGADFADVFSRLPEDITLLIHHVNCGKGRALKTAFEHICRSLPGESAVVVDADGQHLIEDVVRVCEKAAQHPNALVIGSRMFSGNVPFRSRFGNSLTRVVFALASGTRLADTQTGLRVIPASHIHEIARLKGERYEYEMNMLLHCSEAGIKIVEVPIETVYIEDNKSSHFNVLRDSIKIYAVLLKFVCSSLAAFVIDFALLFLFDHLTEGMAGSLLISTLLARAISSCCNFFINKKLVFKRTGGLPSSMAKYYLVVVIIWAGNYGLLKVLHEFMSWPLFPAKLLTEAVLFLFSFVLQRFFVFKKKPADR